MNCPLICSEIKHCTHFLFYVSISSFVWVQIQNSQFVWSKLEQVFVSYTLLGELTFYFQWLLILF